MKFIADRSLGKLSKWLRILGYDTVYFRGDADRNFLKLAQSEGRIVLTRKRELGKRQFMGRILVLEPDVVEDQMREVMRQFSLPPDPDHWFTRCLRCNELLVPLRKEQAKGRVPPYTFETQERFKTCPACGSIYWSGTHKDRAENFFRKHILRDLP